MNPKILLLLLFILCGGSSLAQIPSGNDPKARPGIFVTDFIFGIRGLNQPARGLISITNTGTANLIISGADSLSSPVFEKVKPAPGSKGIIDWEFTQPVVLKVNESVNLLIGFNAGKTGVFTDTLTFTHNDAKLGKDMCVITARVVNGAIIANGADFGAKRVNKGPYTTDKSGEAVVVTIANPSTSSITLNTMEITGGTKHEYFTTESGDRNFTALVADRIVGPGEQFSVKVLYNPNNPDGISATGNHSIEFEITAIDNNNPEPLTARPVVKGTGHLPKLSITPLVDFGSTEVKGATSNSRKMVIRNLGAADGWNYAYDAVITGLSVDPAGAVQVEAGPVNPSNDPANKGFRYVSDTYFGTVRLQPGEAFEIDADFIAQQAGAVTATLTPITEPDVDISTAKSQWIGNGIAISGIAEKLPDTDSIVITPNPAGTFISLSFGKTLDAPVELRLYDARGREVLSRLSAADGARIDIRHLPEGTYFIRIGSSGTTIPVIIAH